MEMRIVLVRCLIVIIAGPGLVLAKTSDAANSTPCSYELAEYKKLNSELKDLGTQFTAEQNKLFESQGKQKIGEPRSSRNKKLTREVRGLNKEYDSKLKAEKESYAIYKSCIESYNANLKHIRQ